MKNSLLKLINFLFVLSFFIVVFGTGYKLGEKQSLNQISKPINFQSSISNFDLFWDVWKNLENKYVDKNKLNQEKMYYGAIKGMVSSLDDPYTFFLTPDENKQAKNDLQGKFEGIGAQLGLKDGRILVIAPLKNSPAEKAGIRAGDFINEVNGEKTSNWSLSQAVSKIRGPKGTKVKLTIERSEKEIKLEITRDEIVVPSVELNYKKNIAIVQINQFGENTNQEWDKKIYEVKKNWQENKIKGMILDLRNNPGGYLESSVYIASEFIPKNKLIVKQQSTVNQSRDYYAEKDGLLLDIPLVVLINQGSASASEILAGALRDYKRAKLVGEKTFGKGSVQEAVDLKYGAGLHVTVAKWILPSGEWINGKGIKPEIEIKNNTDEKNTLTPDNDKQLEKAIDILLK